MGMEGRDLFQYEEAHKTPKEKRNFQSFDHKERAAGGKAAKCESAEPTSSDQRTTEIAFSQRITNEVKDMAKIRVEASEYERLLAVEKEYLRLQSIQQSGEDQIHSAVENEAADPAMEPINEPQSSQEAEVTSAIISGDAILLKETFFRATDAYLLLSRLTVLCKIRAVEGDQVKRDNTAYFLDRDSSESSIKFTANEFQINTDLKMAAKEMIWKETENCRLISSVRESVLECLIQAIL